MITEPQPRLSWGYSLPSSQTGCPMITEPQARLSWGYSLPLLNSTRLHPRSGSTPQAAIWHSPSLPPSKILSTPHHQK
jgi:hypothetical protein